MPRLAAVQTEDSARSTTGGHRLGASFGSRRLDSMPHAVGRSFGFAYGARGHVHPRISVETEASISLNYPSASISGKAHADEAQYQPQNLTQCG